jgi:hypothetical protein
VVGVFVIMLLKILGGALIIALWGYGLYIRGGYRKRKHEADVQTLFSGKR